MPSESKKPLKCYAADFETTSYDDYLIDGFTRVYLWGIQDIESNECIIGDTIEQFIAYLSLLPSGSKVFLHNLKFDGKFIVDYLLKTGWKLGTKPFHFNTVITNMQEWFSITIYFDKSYITINDSLKKFPGMSIASLSRTFGIEGKPSLTIDKRRSPTYVAEDEEIVRVKGDVRILAHALKETFQQGATKDTASSDSFEYFRKSISNSEIYLTQLYAFKRIFPSYFKGKDKKTYLKLEELDAIFRKGYYGGLCYLNPSYQGQIISNVDIFDRNSMYPTVLINYPMPFGRLRHREPTSQDVYIIEIDVIFRLKPGKIPFLQAKTNIYHQNEVLTHSDEYMYFILPSPLYDLMYECYDIIDEIVYNRWVFEAKKGIFDTHINHFYKVKSTTTNPGEKLIAKLRLNSLYGKFGQRHVQRNSIPALEDDDIVHYKPGDEHRSNLQTYLPVAMFTTAYAKCDLVRAANKFGDRFIYCDTDSIHAFHHPDNISLLEIDNSKLGYWKFEGCYPRAKYIRAKVYIHGDENLNVKEVKAAGAPITCKANMTFDNLEAGVEFKGKLQMKTVPGGCVLKETTYKITL